MWKAGLKGRASRSAARSSATGSASIPVTAAASENSQAASAAAAELASGLDFIFDQVNYEEDPGDWLQLHLERLSDEAAKYQNSRFDDSEGERWTCDYDTAQVLYAACQCSCLVYKPIPNAAAELVPVMSRTASVMGVSKAVSMWKISDTDTLIVSVRGTKGMADHMVNLNSEPHDASSIITFGDEEGPMLAHKGFLACAQASIPQAIEEISNQLKADPSISHVVFTGHSAGGSVSSLIFLYLLSHATGPLSSVRFSLATFGCAPVLSTDVAKILKKLPNVGWAFSFVNEYDLVTRADRPYIRSMVDLYRSRLGLPCIYREGQTAFEVADAETSNRKSITISSGRDIADEVNWPLLPAQHQHVGDIVLLRMRLNMDTFLDDSISQATTLPAASLILHRVSSETLNKLVFCDLGVHKRMLYLERMEALASNALRESSAANDSNVLHMDRTSMRDELPHYFSQ